jgi:hypothetical protein
VHKITNVKLLFLAVILGLGSGMSSAYAGADGLYEWQLSQLNTLSTKPKQRKFRVLIVDSVKDRDVDRFMNTRFEMIDRVMFTNVIVTDKNGNPRRNNKTGQYMTEDDGC